MVKKTIGSIGKRVIAIGMSVILVSMGLEIPAYADEDPAAVITESTDMGSVNSAAENDKTEASDAGDTEKSDSVDKEEKESGINKVVDINSGGGYCLRLLISQ